MKLLILDHLRRWWWALALFAILQSIFGWFSATGSPPPKDFSLAMLSILVGPVLLQSSLQRGVARAIVALPLTARQIARSWWLMAVGLPTVTLALFILLGAGFSRLIHPDRIFNEDWLVLNSLVNLMLLGSSFLLFTGFMTGPGGSRWEYARNMICSVIWGASIGGWQMISKHLFDTPTKTMWALAVGTVLTVVGWFRAERMVVQRAGFRPGVQSTQRKPGQYKAPTGFGGLPFLMHTTTLRSVLIGFLMLAMMTLWIPFVSHDSTRMLVHGSMRTQIISSMATTTSMPLLFVAMFQIFPVVLQIRFLRTLPISPSVLAATLVFLPMISVGVLCLITVALAGPMAGVAVLLPVFKNFLLTVTLSAIAILLIVSRGLDILTYFLIVFGCIVSTSLSLMLHGAELPLWGNVTLAVVIIGTSLAVTRRVLTRSSHAYRVLANPFGAGWGAGR
ncbi:MAG: hypothetical protein NTZ16_03145 [Verrucomicrobia bacterium]|nr:hypothetical protein [Verrucomicrobiota bacterium]